MDGDTFLNIDEYNAGTDPTDPSSVPAQYACLEILSVSAWDLESSGIPVSGKPAEVEVTVRNTGNSPTENRWVDVGVFSIDVQGEDCDLWGDNWQNGEKLLQVQTFNYVNIPRLDTGEQIKLTFEYIFVNACFTDKLLIVMTPDDTTPFCSTKTCLQKDITPFKPMPNPDAFFNCVSVLSTSLIAPFLNEIVEGGSALIELTKLASMDYHKYVASLQSGDFREIGKATFTYVWDTGKAVFKLSGKAIISKFMNICKAAYNEMKNQGCGEAFPHWWSFLSDFFKGICDKISDVGHNVWAFIFGSPADVEVIDSLGNSIYVGQSGTEANTIPDAEGFTVDDGSDDPIKTVLILGNGPFAVNLYGTSNGSGSFHVTQPKADGDVAFVRYDIIPLTSDTEGSLNVDASTSSYPFAIDSDGDGTVDQTVQPDGVEVLVPEDIDSDGYVDEKDLAIFGLNFGRADCEDGPLCDGDFDHDGAVDGSDLATFVAQFGL